MNIRHAVIDNPNAAFGQLVVDARYFGFIAGDCLGGENRCIPSRQMHRGVRVSGNPRHCCTALALRSGHEIEQMIVWDFFGLVLRNRLRKVLHDAGLHRRLDHAAHCAPRYNNRTARVACGLGQRFQTGDIRGKSRRRDLAVTACDDITQRLLDFVFRARDSRLEDIG